MGASIACKSGVERLSLANMRVQVGTQNKLKLGAVREVFLDVLPQQSLKVVAVPVESGVPAQPFGEEVMRGAIQRARAAVQGADYGVGIEAGLVRFPGCDRHTNIQSCAIISKSGRISVGHGPGFELPKDVLDQLERGATLNQVMSSISGIDNIKDKIGAIGWLSEERIDRFTITREAVLMALIPLIRRFSIPHKQH